MIYEVRGKPGECDLIIHCLLQLDKTKMKKKIFDLKEAHVPLFYVSLPEFFCLHGLIQFNGTFFF